MTFFHYTLCNDINIKGDNGVFIVIWVAYIAYTYTEIDLKIIHMKQESFFSTLCAILKYYLFLFYILDKF